MSKFKQSFLTIAIGLALVAGISYAWTGPTANPPLNNAPAPINVSVLNQVIGNPSLSGQNKNLSMGNGQGILGLGGSMNINGSMNVSGVSIFKGGTNKDGFTSFFPNANGNNYVRGKTIFADGGIKTDTDRSNNRVGIGTANPQAKLDIATNDPENKEWALRVKDGADVPNGYVLTSFTEGSVDGLVSWAPAPKATSLSLTVKENAGTASCGAKGVTNTTSLGRNHFCYMQAIDFNYHNSGDTWRGVYPTDNPDESGKRNWNVGITCYNDEGSITAVCVNF